MHRLTKRYAAVCSATLVVLSLHGIAATSAQAAPRARHAPVHLILDTDISTDVDDVGALALANASQDNGKVDLLAVMVDTASKWGAPAVDAINTYYGHSNIPIGTLKPTDDSTYPIAPNYTKYLTQHFRNSVKDGNKAPDAVKLYRKILAKQPNHSVTIASVGFLINLSNLLDSGPDQYSRLDGFDLVAQKVKELDVMGGGYPVSEYQGTKFAEWNFAGPAEGGGSGPAATQNVVGNWPTRIVFDGFEVGLSVMTGSELYTQTPVTNPVRKAYEIYAGFGNDHPSFDPSDVFYAIYGLDQLFTHNTDPGSNHVNADGSNEWASSPVKDQNYLVKVAADPTIARAISDLMVQPPRKGAKAH
jgi:hypothetical protein